jgi:dTDP-4-dehydrorhamnose 3,5-epimerase
MDSRGTFVEFYRERDLKSLLGNLHFVQNNYSVSNAYVLRGMHFQHGPCGKLVRCIAGSAFQVSVDVRENSPTFGAYVAAHISDKTMSAIWVPPGFANGFMAQDRGATVLYSMTDYYDAEKEQALVWNDKEVGIKWPAGVNTPLTISGKDRNALTLDKIVRWRG